jgi:hypothetical protein
MMVTTVSQEVKDALNEQYECLDPVALLEELKNCKANCLNMLGAAAALS